MKHIVYIGNKLSHVGKTVTSIETLGQFLKNEGYNVVTSSSKTNKVFRMLDMLYTILQNLKKTDYVLIDVYSTSNFYYALIISVLCKMLKLKYVPILRGGALGNRLKKSPKLSKLIFNNAYENVAPSLYLMSIFKEAGFKNIIHIPNTIELQNYDFNIRSINAINLLWVRSFSNLYNPKLAVQILKSIRDDNINASLCMIGPDNDGSLEDTKALSETLGVKVEFTGKLSKREWHKKAEDYNLFINTTNVDNTPVSVIEAMALGLPVISTNVGGLPHLIDSDINGILVPPDDIQAFKAAILRLKDDPSLVTQISNNARKKVEAFDWNTVKYQWFSILS